MKLLWWLAWLPLTGVLAAPARERVQDLVSDLVLLGENGKVEAPEIKRDGEHPTPFAVLLVLSEEGSILNLCNLWLSRKTEAAAVFYSAEHCADPKRYREPISLYLVYVNPNTGRNTLLPLSRDQLRVFSWTQGMKTGNHDLLQVSITPGAKVALQPVQSADAPWRPLSETRETVVIWTYELRLAEEGKSAFPDDRLSHKNRGYFRRIHCEAVWKKAPQFAVELRKKGETTFTHERSFSLPLTPLGKESFDAETRHSLYLERCALEGRPTALTHGMSGALITDNVDFAPLAVVSSGIDVKEVVAPYWKKHWETVVGGAAKEKLQSSYDPPYEAQLSFLGNVIRSYPFAPTDDVFLYGVGLPLSLLLQNP